jgi:hypothetical protein
VGLVELLAHAGEGEDVLEVLLLELSHGLADGCPIELHLELPEHALEHDHRAFHREPVVVGIDMAEVLGSVAHRAGDVQDDELDTPSVTPHLVPPRYWVR